MAAHNYDGDMLTDEVAQVHRSPGFITSNLIGKNEDGSLIKGKWFSLLFMFAFSALRLSVEDLRADGLRKQNDRVLTRIYSAYCLSLLFIMQSLRLRTARWRICGKCTRPARRPA